jgi:hypothetical protein
MRMTLVYTRIADRTDAEQYFAAADRVDALYNQRTKPVNLPEHHADLSPETPSFAEAKPQHAP